MVKEILRRELVGLKVRIVAADNSQLVGIGGQVLDETRNTITVSDGKIKKTIPKDKVVIETQYKGKIIRVDGKMFLKRPEDRIKVK